MKIFEKRPLALILGIMLGGFSFFADFTWQIKVISAAVALLIIGIIFVFDNLKSGRNALTVISLVAFALSLLLSCWWESAFYPDEFYDSEVSITAKIYDVDNSASSTSVLICKTETINDKRDNHTVILYVDKEIAVRVRRYDIVSFNAIIKEITPQDDGFDGRSYYVSKGYSARCNYVSDLTVKGNEPDKIDRFLSTLRLKISNTLKKRTDFNTGAFLSALIVGDRSDLSGNTKLNFARLGISHILALSGMHLAILSLALNFVLIRAGIKKKIRVSLLSLIIVFYMGLTGFTPSVLRSGSMLIISGVLYLLARKADALTSLFISVFVIVIFNPVSVYDMSLWLSAFATLGVVVFSEIAEKSEKLDTRLKRLWIWFKNACLVSVFAFCATFAFTALRFDAFSVVSIFTTLLFSFVIQLFIYGGLLLLIFGGVIPFGCVIVFFSNAILWLAELISSCKFVYVSMDSFAVKMLIVLLTVFFFAFLVLDMRSKRKGIAITVILLSLIFVFAEAHTLINRYDDGITYSPSASGDVMILKSGGEVNAIYSGKAYADGAWDVLDAFTQEKLTYIDTLIFASYSYSTIDFINTVIDGIKIDRIMLPTPNTDDEIGVAEGLSYLLSDYGAYLEFYDIPKYISLGEYRYRLLEKVDYTYGEYPSNVYEIVAGEERYTYLSVCDYDELSVSARDLIWNSENLVIGSIGNTNYYIFDMRLSHIKNIYYYDKGRLTEDAEEFYKNKGASVHCTKTPIDILD